MSAALLVDTAIWVDHFSGRGERLIERLASDPIHIHEVVLGELALGFLPRRHAVTADLDLIPRLATLAGDEVLRFVRLNRLEGSGIGWADAHLLASAKVFDAVLWTRDKAVLKAAKKASVPVDQG